MNTIIHYFSNVPDYHRIVLLAICLLSFGNLELWFPFKKTPYKFKHICTNLLFTLPAIPVQFAIGFVLLIVLKFTRLDHFGILNHLPFKSNNIQTFIIGFILLDFLEYIYHLFMHKVKGLWMFHLVHHSDRELTVSTTLREHPVETGIRLLFLIFWVFFTGISLWALLFRQFVQIVSNVFVHSNFRLNDKFDKLVSLLFVTPNMHQVHHHYLKPLTDQNYGDVLSIWDRIFGTFTIKKGTDLTFGVDTYYDKKENANFITLLKIPFGKYRPSIDLINEKDSPFLKS